MVELELKDWKDLETSAISGIRQAKMQLCVHEELLEVARFQIRELGGVCESATLGLEDGKIKQ